MAKIRHIAYRAEDVDGMANFFVNALGMTIKQKRKNKAIDLSDGTINITVLTLRAGKSDGEPTRRAGIDHIGIKADNYAEEFHSIHVTVAHKYGIVHKNN